MNETIVLAVIAFFSTLVTMLTAAIGYFKVLKPSRSQNGKISNVETLLSQYSVRIDTLEKQCKRLEDEVTDCRKDRLELKRENYALLKENSELRRSQKR